MKKILIADDEQFIRELVTSTIVGEGYQIFEARNGREALEVAREEIPDLILLDIMMPVIDGITVLKELKAEPKTASIKVLVLSAYGQIGEVRNFKDLGAEDYMLKPFSPTTLVKKINEILADVT